MIESLGKLEKLSTHILNRSGCVHFTFEHNAYYRLPRATVLLHILLVNTHPGHHCIITDKDLESALPGLDVTDPGSLAAVADRLELGLIDLSRPLELDPVYIAKPWGREIWYSGIERRGVSTVNGTPLSWLLDIFGRHLGCPKEPMLLKILDPFPEPNLGDLYFEMHEHKVEVYVVTHVDEASWPEGIGRIRYGFNQERLSGYDSTAQFLKAYIDSVNEYRAVRVEIDERLTRLHPVAPLNPAKYKELMKQVPDELKQKEVQLRELMYEFTSTRDLVVGDVITVAPFVPHSLQRGVRVIEFQTPHYERYILSFGQKVLTQDHWDTEKALDLAITDDIDFEPPRAIRPGQDLVADFKEFQVTRVRLSPGETTQYHPAGYAIIIGVTGETELKTDNSSVTITPEAAFFVAPADELEFNVGSSTTGCILIAEEC